MAPLLLLLGSACIFASERRATVDVNLQASSSHVFRGQTMTARPVAQGESTVHLPTKDGGTGSLGAWGNMDLTDHVGDAWFDGGHAGEFTQCDVWAAYDRRLGPVDAAIGLRHYLWPGNERFPFQPFPSTSEVFVRVGGEALGLHPALTAHYDIDEVESLYLRADLTHSVELAKTVRLELQAWLGWSDEKHSQWLYRTAKSGFSDAGCSAGIAVDLDPVTSLHFAAATSSIVDSAMRDWCTDHTDADLVWFTAGVAWAF